jgi:ribosomal protein S21
MKHKRNNYERHIGGTLSVSAHECAGDAEKMVRKFIRKAKKEGIMEEIRARSHFVKPSQVRAERKRNKKRLIQKINKKRTELFTTRDKFKRRSG